MQREMLVAGSSIATCSDMFGIKSDLTDAFYLEIITLIQQQIIDKAKEIKTNMIFIKEFNEVNSLKVKNILTKDFLLCNSMATTFLYTGKINDKNYEQALNKKYRSVFKKRKKDFEQQNLHWQVSYDFAIYAEKMHQLYMNVLKVWFFSIWQCWAPLKHLDNIGGLQMSKELTFLKLSRNC